MMTGTQMIGLHPRSQDVMSPLNETLCLINSLAQDYLKSLSKVQKQKIMTRGKGKGFHTDCQPTMNQELC